MPSPSLPSSIQKKLERLYGLEAPPVDDFVRAANDGREVLTVRQRRGVVDLALYLPREGLGCEGVVSLDVYCQVVEGVSHFLYLVERARRELPATQLELELQAEVDKYCIVREVADVGGERGEGDLRERLFGRVSFSDEKGTERGERYRLANQLAARFVPSLRRQGADATRLCRDRLRRFFGAGQREKLEMVMAA